MMQYGKYLLANKTTLIDLKCLNLSFQTGLFYKAVFFLSYPQKAYDFSNFSLILCLQYASNKRICCHGRYVVRDIKHEVKIIEVPQKRKR